MVATETTHFVKVRERGRKKFYFLASEGKLTRLRFHALRFTKESAKSTVAELSADAENAYWEFKTQKMK